MKTKRLRAWGAESLRRLLVPALLLSIAAAGCGQQAGEKEKAGQTAARTGDKSAKEAARAVDVVRPERHAVRQQLGQPGHIEAFEETPLYARIPGYIRKYHVDIGDEIKGPAGGESDGKAPGQGGQLLAELSVPEMVADLEQKKALATKAAEEIKQAVEIVKVAEAVYHSALARVEEEKAGRLQAQAEYNRWDVEYRKAAELVARGNLDQQTRDVTLFQREAAMAAKVRVEAKVQSAEAAVKESKARWEKAKIDVQVAQARHGAAEAERDVVAAMLAYAEIRAPYNGVVMVRNINPGDFVQPATAGKVEPLFVVARTDRVRIFIAVPETEAVFIDKNATARIRVRGLKGEELEGKVVRTSWGVRGKERTLRTEIDLENRDGRLRDGMYAFAILTMEHKDVWTLPVAAVAVADEQPFCVRVENGKAVRTPLQLGLSDGKRVEVRKKLVGRMNGGQGGAWQDFNGAEEVVASNPGALTDGQALSARGRSP
jgi:RND family efflux transporter MFP subunit